MSKPHGFFKNMTEEEIKDYFRKHHNNRTLSQVSREDRGAYVCLRTRGLVDKLVDEGTLVRKKKPINHWNSLDNILNEFKFIIEQIGHFPTITELEALGRGDLIRAYRNKSIKIEIIAKMMGYETKTKPNGYWKRWGNVKNELEKVIAETGHFPNSSELVKMKESSLQQSIIEYHGGFQRVRKRMGYDPITSKPAGYWQNEANVIRELRKVIKKLGYFPSSEELKKLNMSFLAKPIFKYHGGMSNLAIKMGYKPKQRPKGYWQNFENIRKELENIIEEIGHFPTMTELNDIDKQYLATALSRHGGAEKVRKRMGYDLFKKSKGYWDDFKNFQKELEPIIKSLGHFPTKTELDELKRVDLSSAINEHGGFPTIRQRMGYGNSIPEEIEEEFSYNIENDEKALEILKHFSDDEKDAADLLVALNPKKFKYNTYRILSLGQYLGKFRMSVGGMPIEPDEVLHDLEGLVDKNELARSIILRKAFQLYEQHYVKDREGTLQELETKVSEGTETLKGIYAEIYRNMLELDGYKIPGARDSLED